MRHQKQIIMLTAESIKEALKNLPAQIIVRAIETKFMSTPIIYIHLFCSDKNINNVDGQKPQKVTLVYTYNPSRPQEAVLEGHFTRIWREVNKDNYMERRWAMVGEKVPFRRTRGTDAQILKAITRFGENYVATLKANKDVIRYKDLCDYSFLN